MKEILRERHTSNLRQLKKLVDEALSKGADYIHFDFRNEKNQYFIFNASLTPEEEVAMEIDKLERDYNKKMADLQKRKFKTYTFRKDQYTYGQAQLNEVIAKFVQENNIKGEYTITTKQVITDDYDDFDDRKETVFITERL